MVAVKVAVAVVVGVMVVVGVAVGVAVEGEVKVVVEKVMGNFKMSEVFTRIRDKNWKCSIRLCDMSEVQMGHVVEVEDTGQKLIEVIKSCPNCKRNITLYDLYKEK